MGNCVTGARVAEVVAAGLSNKQVTEQLYLSVYTVEAHLSQAYAKLGIGSRTQLARVLAPRERSAAGSIIVIGNSAAFFAWLDPWGAPPGGLRGVAGLPA